MFTYFIFKNSYSNTNKVDTNLNFGRIVFGENPKMVHELDLVAISIFKIFYSRLANHLNPSILTPLTPTTPQALPQK